MAKELDAKHIEAGRNRQKHNSRREEEKQRIREAFEDNKKASRVVVIPATVASDEALAEKRLRVCAYCRVSTAEENQAGSFEIQCQHFKQMIENNPNWELKEIFSDEGVSGTSVDKRKGFQRMIQAAQNHEIDLILTKSISRFGRNIVDILTNLRLLSSLVPAVTVSFETEGITTGDGKNSLIISILSALAELESQQKSEAVKAGIRIRMQEGIFKYSVRNTLGYYRDFFGVIKVDESEAEIVKYIYDAYLEGASLAEIARYLTSKEIPTPTGLYKWLDRTIRGILTNEKYYGAALMQKTYTEDFLTHKAIPNRGKLPKFMIENDHEAIIDKAKWLLVQEELKSRKDPHRHATPKELKNRFMPVRVKTGGLQGYFLLDVLWSAEDRSEFLKIIDSTNNNL